MALAVALSKLIEDTQIEAGVSVNPALGQNFRATVIRAINRAQAHYINDHKWPHLRGLDATGYFDKESVLGERFYDYPVGMAPDTIRSVSYEFGTAMWQPLTYGIALSDYASYDSDDPAIMGDPALKWRRHSPTQFEVWPRSAVSGSRIRFDADAAPTELTDDAHTCVIDSEMIVLRAAGYLTVKKDRKAAEVFFTDADTSYRNIRHKQDGDKQANLAGPAEDPAHLPRIIVVNGG